MKHKYVLIVELEGQSDITGEKKSQSNAVKEFYREFFKDKMRILTFFRNTVYNFMLEGRDVFTYKDKKSIIKSIVIERDLIKPVLEKLTPASKAEILKILATDRQGSRFWEDFFELFSLLRINKISFLASGKEKE